MHPITYYENHLVVTFADAYDKGVTAVRFLWRGNSLLMEIPCRKIDIYVEILSFRWVHTIIHAIQEELSWQE